MIKINAEFNTPSLPRFLYVQEDRRGSETAVRIELLDEDQLREIGARWTDALVERAQELRQEGGY